MFNKIKYPLGIGMLNFFQNNKLPQQKLQPSLVSQILACLLTK